MISKRFLKGLGSQMDPQNNKRQASRWTWWRERITPNQLDLLDRKEHIKMKSPEVDVLMMDEEHKEDRKMDVVMSTVSVAPVGRHYRLLGRRDRN